MTGIYRYAENPFDSRLISDDRALTFAADAASRMQATHPELARAINRKQEIFSQVLGALTVVDENKKAHTDGLDVFIDELATYMTEAQDQVAVSLKRGSAAFNAIYPRGRQTYTRLLKTEAPAVLDALKATIDQQGSALPPEMSARMAGFRAAWDDARAAQNASEGTLAGTRNERDRARTELNDTLFETLLTLSLEFRKTPSRLKSFFDHHLLDAPRHASLERPAAGS